MATGKSQATTPKRWIDGKCGKHTPEETREWIKDSWTNSVHPEFVRFRNHIADKGTDIPTSFFSTFGLTHGNKNPLFAFIRPSKLLYIAIALEDCKPAEETNIKGILAEYLKQWEDGLLELGTRYQAIGEINQARHHLMRAVGMIDSFRYMPPEQISQEWYNDYKENYKHFCETFDSIPCQISSQRQTLNAVRIAVRETLGDTKRKQKKPDREKDEKRREIAAIVKQIIFLKNCHHKGKKGMSVEKAIAHLEDDANFWPILRKCGFTLNTWKKYVANARKEARKE